MRVKLLQNHGKLYRVALETPSHSFRLGLLVGNYPSAIKKAQQISPYVKLRVERFLPN